MKWNRWVLGPIAAAGVIGGFAGCDRGAPTEPDRGALVADAATSPTINLSGSWTGTITFPAPDDPEGDESYATPCDGPQKTAVTLAQVGSSLTGGLASCAGLLEIQGVVMGTQISETVASSKGQSYGKIIGTASSKRIQFRTLLTGDDQDDPEGRDNDGDATFVSSQVDLSPLPLGVRRSPVAVDSPRAPRVLSTRR